jgi:hypothetical protein
VLISWKINSSKIYKLKQSKRTKVQTNRNRKLLSISRTADSKVRIVTCLVNALQWKGSGDKLATQSTQGEEKHNTICPGHHYVQTNHVSKMYVHSDYIIIYLYFRPWILFNPATFHWSAYIPNLSLKCLYAKPFIEVPIYQTFHWRAYIPNV